MFPDGLLYIGEEAFWGCDMLKKVSLPNTTLIIENRAFGHCYKLKDIVLPCRIQYISDELFAGNGFNLTNEKVDYKNQFTISGSSLTIDLYIPGDSTPYTPDAIFTRQ